MQSWSMSLLLRFSVDNQKEVVFGWVARLFEPVTLHGLELSVSLSPKVSGWGFYNWVS